MKFQILASITMAISEISKGITDETISVTNVTHLMVDPIIPNRNI